MRTGNVLRLRLMAENRSENRQKGNGPGDLGRFAECAGEHSYNVLLLVALPMV